MKRDVSKTTLVSLYSLLYPSGVLTLVHYGEIIIMGHNLKS